MKSRSEKVSELEKIIIRFNLERGNTAFKGANEKTGKVDLDVGDRVFIPGRGYIVKVLKVSESSICILFLFSL